MEKLQFSTEKQRVVIDVIPFTEIQFFDMMYVEKPTEIYNGHWSDKVPFIVITEYNEDGMLLYCNALADKTPKQKTVKQLYTFLKNQGLSQSYILINKKQLV